MKKSYFLWCFLLLNFSLLGQISAAEPLRLVIPQFPPYTSEKNGTFSGIGIDMIKRLMQEVQVDYQLRSTPNYARALEQLTHDKADGFFLASENNQRNAVAVFSEPLLINRWSWFFPPQTDYKHTSNTFKSLARVATIHGSNTYRWLIEHNYNVSTKANVATTFPTLLLKRNRIDAVFLASVVFRNELDKQGYANDDYVEVVQKAKPFGIYISKRYLKKHPFFMSKLNKGILKVQNLQ